nr:unnamed protein product [Callosobruchus analis]
MTYFNGTWLI